MVGRIEGRSKAGRQRTVSMCEQWLTMSALQAPRSGTSRSGADSSNERRCLCPTAGCGNAASAAISVTQMVITPRPAIARV